MGITWSTQQGSTIRVSHFQRSAASFRQTNTIAWPYIRPKFGPVDCWLPVNKTKWDRRLMFEQHLLTMPDYLKIQSISVVGDGDVYLGCFSPGWIDLTQDSLLAVHGKTMRNLCVSSDRSKSDLKNYRVIIITLGCDLTLEQVRPRLRQSNAKVLTI